MNKPQKKKSHKDVIGYLENIGYNKACDDWEAWLKEQNKEEEEWMQ